MEIKFWDKEKKEYDNQNNYYVCEDGQAMELYGGMDASLEIVTHIEPHFYINGERVA